MTSSAAATAGTALVARPEPAPVPAKRSRLRVLFVAVLFGMLAPLVAVATPAQAAARVQPRTSVENSIQDSVLNMLNQQRRAHRLPPLRMNERLKNAARSHNAMMARNNTMSHQVRGEASLSRRIDRAGYNWSNIAENIGWNSDMSRGGVLLLQKLMYNERAPYDGHRQNILGRSYREIGVDVYFDRAHGKVWLTTDFGRSR